MATANRPTINFARRGHSNINHTFGSPLDFCYRIDALMNNSLSLMKITLIT